MLVVTTVVLDFYGLTVAPSPALAASTSFTFVTPSDYVYDTSKIAVTSGSAKTERAPAWWNSAYSYRQKITVTANGSNDITTSNTITVNKDIAALVTATKMQADHDDLRIVYWNGTTNTDLDRDFLDLELGTAPTLSAVRFKAQAAVSAGFSDDGYYLYYGNGSAVTPPVNPDNIYTYNEDFASDPGWSTNNGSCNATTSVSTGRLRKTGTTTTTDCFRYDSVNTFDTTKNWYEEITVRRNGGNLASIGWRDFNGGVLGGWWFQSDDFNDIVKIWSSSGGLQNHSAFAQTNGVDYRYSMLFERLAAWEPTCSGDTGWARMSGYINGTRYMQQTDWQGSVCGEAWSPSVHTYDTATAEWDDVKVWENINETIVSGSEEPRYPNDDPTITPVSTIGFTRLDGFAETATKNGGEIKYILSNDGGTTWKYYNSGWVSSNASYAQASTASAINSNVATFPVGSGSLLVRAFLHSDGTQQVLLDTLTITVNSSSGIPTLSSPADTATNVSVTPALQLSATDSDSDYLRYKLQIDTVNTFNSANLQTFDQTASQTGWSGQNAQSSTAYASGATATLTVPTKLSYDTTYYWRAAAIDPGGINTFSAYSNTRSFSTQSTGSVTVNGSAAQTNGIFNNLVSLTQYPTIAGEAKPNSIITVTIGAYIYSATTTAAGVWTLTVTEPLPLGAYEAYASVNVGSDFTAIKKIAQFSVASAAYVPIPTIVTPTAGQWFITSTLKVIGLARSTNTVHFFIDGGFAGTATTTTSASGTGHFIFTTPTLEIGSHTLSIEATNAQGNFSSRSAPLTFKIGLPTIGPTIFSVTPGSAVVSGIGWGDTDVTVLANGTAIGVFYIGGSGIRPFSYKLPITTDGRYAIKMKAVDNQNKPSRFSNTAYYTHGGSTVTYAVPVSNQSTYAVKNGDSLWKIAAEVYGNGALLTKLVEANKAAHPEIATGAHIIRVGWILTIP